MPITTTTATFRIRGLSPYSQSRPHNDEREPGEGHDDYRERTWRSYLHADKGGEVFIPPGAIKNCVAEAAKFMNISVPGKGKSTYTKHVEAGTACVRPVALRIRADEVDSENLFLPADGKTRLGYTSLENISDHPGMGRRGRNHRARRNCPANQPSDAKSCPTRHL